MGLKENLSYWDFSLKNEEPIEDNYYVFDEIIIDNPSFIKQVENLRELIVKFCNSSKTGNDENILDEVYNILNNTENIQHHEFIAFWKVLGTTYSTYESFKEEKKRGRLKELLIKYCQMRLKMYNNLNYSNITIQALYDKGASRRTGIVANKKIIDLLATHFENICEVRSLDEFEDNDISFFRLEKKTGRVIFDDFFKKVPINRPISEKSFNITIKIKDQIFLIKTKHMKEAGGSQNSKIVELINFIEQSEESNNIHYVTFIDGIFFNRFGNKFITGKAKSQKKLIEKTLNQHKNNFFVNTNGLNLIFKDLK